MVIDVGHMGSNAMLTWGTQIPTFRRNILPSSSRLKFTRLYYPEDQHRHLHGREKLKPHVM
jgi:hypothetical protein